MIADKPLAEFYLESKLGGPQQQQQGSPLYELRTKLIRTLTDCSNLLQAYKPLASDPDQKKNLRRIRKKLSHCQNPDKAGVAGQKRIPAAAAAAAVAAAGDPATSESEMERLAKKRKLDGEQPMDIFGGELVTQRTKDAQQP